MPNARTKNISCYKGESTILVKSARQSTVCRKSPLGFGEIRSAVICFIAIIVLPSTGLTQSGSGLPASSVDEHLVIVFEMAESDENRRLERAFLEELILVLDNFRIMTISYKETSGSLQTSQPRIRPPNSRPPNARPTSEQISAELLEIARREGAGSVVWLDIPTVGKPILRVYKTDDPEGHLNHVASKRNAEVSSALALTTRALLEDLGITAPTPTEEPLEAAQPEIRDDNSVEPVPSNSASPTEGQGKISKSDSGEPKSSQNDMSPPAPDDVRSTRKPEKETLSAAQSQRRAVLALGLSAELEGEVFGATGLFLQVGGRVFLSYAPWKLLFVRAAFRATSGPFDQPSIQVDSWSLEPGIELGVPFELGALSLGPFLGVYATTNRLEIDDGADVEKFHWWAAEATVGAELCWMMGRRFGLLLDAGFGVRLGPREVFQEGGLARTLLSWPYLSWLVSLGGVIIMK